jgi:twitching motility protein PilU
MGKSNNLGMRTFDQALYELYKEGEITYDEALHNADSANELRLMIKLDKKMGIDEEDAGQLDGITLVGVDEI